MPDNFFRDRIGLELKTENIDVNPILLIQETICWHQSCVSNVDAQYLFLGLFPTMGKLLRFKCGMFL